MVIIVMGVRGCGKTHIGGLLASRLGWIFLDADDHHPEANIAKMASGVPLTDADRKPWLERLRVLLGETDRAGRDAVLACSALRRTYRELIAAEVRVPRFVYLRAEEELLRQRLESRKNHFFRGDLLESQISLLEEPADAITLDASMDPDEAVTKIIDALSLR